MAGNEKLCDGQTQNFPTDCYSPHPQWRMGTKNEFHKKFLNGTTEHVHTFCSSLKQAAQFEFCLSLSSLVILKKEKRKTFTIQELKHATPTKVSPESIIEIVLMPSHGKEKQ